MLQKELMAEKANKYNRVQALISFFNGFNIQKITDRTFRKPDNTYKTIR